MKLSFKFIFSISIVLTSTVSLLFANENFDSAKSYEYTKEVKNSLEAIKILAPQKYFSEIDKYRSSLEKYINYKKRVCNGEFSTLILNEKDKSTKRSKKRLSVQERRLCLREMKALQITFINNMFLARKRYLDYLHGLRIEELRKIKEATIRSLKLEFDRKRR